MRFSDNKLYKPKFSKEWEKYILLELAEWINGRAFKKDDYSDEGWPVIKIAELNNGINDNTQHSNISGIDKKYSLTRGDLLFSWSGNPRTSINSFIYLLDNGWLNQHIYKIVEGEKIRKYYLYYLLKYLRPNFEIIASNKQTTGLGHITKKDLSQFIVRIPSLSEQKAIASTLSALDDKIELNNRINKNLEVQAQTLFKHWFVDFEFPDENGNPYKSSGGAMVDSELGRIPDGWKVEELGNIVNIKYGKNLPTKKLLENGYDVFGGNGIIGYYSEYTYEEPEVLIACRGAASGKTNISTPKSFVTNNSLILESSSRIDFEYIKNRFFFKDLQEYATGSAQPQITINNIKGIKIILPERDILGKFFNLVTTMSIMIENISKQNQILSQLRDTLLPKLMSGQIRIPLED